jgi:peroxiredoxin
MVAIRLRSIAVATAALIAAAMLRPAVAADAGPQVGAPAPLFSGVDSNGNPRSLAEFRGKTVVLEWTNHDCPYVIKHYGSGNMQALQRDATARGVVWLAVISSAQGEQGYVSGPEANRIVADRQAAPTATILDPDGTIGRAYGARTTPHMYIIDGAGTLVYMGGIDDRPTTDKADIAGARNFVRAALDDMTAGRPVGTPTSRPYGCSVKYNS